MNWAVLQKIILVIGVIPAIVGIISIWEWWNKSVPSLTARVRYSDFVPVPQKGGSSLSLTHGIWFVDISNDSEVGASDVSLQVDGASIVQIKRVDQEIETRDVKEIINLGELRSQEEVSITVWTTSSGSEYGANKIVLRHENGIGKVKVYHPVSPIWYQLSQKFRVIIIALATGILALMTILTSKKDEKRSEKPTA